LVSQQRVDSSQKQSREYHRAAGTKCFELALANPPSIGRVASRLSRFERPDDPATHTARLAYFAAIEGRIWGMFGI